MMNGGGNYDRSEVNAVKIFIECKGVIHLMEFFLNFLQNIFINLKISIENFSF
jgi:hypothetical protein